MIKAKISIEVEEDISGLNFKLERQGNNVALPIYYMLLQYGISEISKARDEKDELK